MRYSSVLALGLVFSWASQAMAAAPPLTFSGTRCFQKLGAFHELVPSQLPEFTNTVKPALDRLAPQLPNFTKAISEVFDPGSRVKWYLVNYSLDAKSSFPRFYASLFSDGDQVAFNTGSQIGIQKTYWDALPSADRARLVLQLALMTPTGPKPVADELPQTGSLAQAVLGGKPATDIAAQIAPATKKASAFVLRQLQADLAQSPQLAAHPATTTKKPSAAVQSTPVANQPKAVAAETQPVAKTTPIRQQKQWDDVSRDRSSRERVDCQSGTPGSTDCAFLDNTTRLIWTGVTPGYDRGTTLNWTGALDACDKLVWAGLADWSVPSAGELYVAYRHGLLRTVESGLSKPDTSLWAVWYDPGGSVFSSAATQVLDWYSANDFHQGNDGTAEPLGVSKPFPDDFLAQHDNPANWDLPWVCVSHLNVE